MLFEFSIAKKYLVPKKKQLSLSLIALMSVGVISLVVWLVLVFLSVTDGIEKSWLKKLTSFNAPIQITPTEAYYQSYYYQVDSLSHQSDYTYKSIGEKASALLTDPYLPDEDLALPSYWPNREIHPDGTPKDLVKLAFTSIEKMGKKLTAQDYEVSGALLKLRLIRPQGPTFSPQEHHAQGHLTQASYINSFSSKSPQLGRLIEPPRIEDLNHLFYLAELSSEDAAIDQPDRVTEATREEVQQKLAPLLKHATLRRVKTTGTNISFLAKLLPENTSFSVLAYLKQGRPSYFTFSDFKQLPASPFFEKGTLIKKQGKLIYTSADGSTSETGLTIPLFTEEPLSMDVISQPSHVNNATAVRDIVLEVQFHLQGHHMSGKIPFENIEIEQADMQTIFDEKPALPPHWAYRVQESSFLPTLTKRQGSPVILPKSFQANGVRVGDQGYFSYSASAASSVQEQRLPVTVVGFYDPGVMAIGARMILTDHDIVHTINTSSQTFTYDQNMKNGIQVWVNNLDDVPQVLSQLTQAFDEAGILPYWKLTPYYEYDFAKDLLQQFQSDKYLFTLVGIIVLIVACSNIISLLVILVNDKKREIAILSAMGTSKKSIAGIFTLCGGLMGCFSTLIGTIAALLTIHHIDAVVSILSFLQGHEAFNAVFYGKSLPNELSERALIFILVATPIISLIAGLVPALKACKLHPSTILRSE